MSDHQESADRLAEVQPLSPRLTLASQGTSALREMILGGVLRPGERLNEGELSTALGISRAPVREAIRHLASEGLLTIVTHKGAFVPSYTGDDLRDIYEVRIALETHATRLAAEHATPGQLDELTALLADAAVSIELSGSPAYPHDLDFHRLLVRLTGNRQLENMATAVDQKLQLARIRSGHLPERAHEALEEHRGILQALAARDANQAAELMTRHLRTSLANVLRLSEQAKDTRVSAQ
jgi:DNA-binding GntR family transcriptional regulator